MAGGGFFVVPRGGKGGAFCGRDGDKAGCGFRIIGRCSDRGGGGGHITVAHFAVFRDGLGGGGLWSVLVVLVLVVLFRLFCSCRC